MKKLLSDNPVTHLSSQRRLWISLGLGVTYIIVVVMGAMLSDSLTLLADASHMLGHSLALGVAITASVFAQRLSSDQYSHGYQRLESIGGYTNGLLLIVIGLSIGYEAIGRFYVEHHELHEGHGHTVDASLMGMVALVGLVLHGISAYVLYGGRKESLNIYALYLHLFYDVTATLTGLVTSLLIQITGRDILDSASGFIIAALILFSGTQMVRKSLRTLARMVPVDAPDVKKIRKSVCGLQHITDIHDILLQPLGGAGGFALSAHIVVSQDCADTEHWEKCRQEVEALLAGEFEILTTVLQVETQEV